MNSNSELSDLATSAGFGLIGRFVGRFIVVLNGILAARFLGPDIFGLYSIGLAMIRVMETIIPLGFDVGIVKYSAGVYGENPGKFKGLLVYSFGIVLLFAGLVSALMYLLAPWISVHLFEKDALASILQFLAIALPLMGVTSLLSSVITTVKDVRYAVLIQDVGQPVFAFIVLIFFYWLGYALNGILLSHLFSYGIAAGIAFYLLRRSFMSIFCANVGPLFPPSMDYYMFSLVSSSTALVSTLMLWVDRLILGRYVSTYDIGIYQSASQLAVIFAVILSGLSRIFVPLFARLKNQNNISELRNTYRIGTKWSVSLGVPVLIFLLINNHDVLNIVYGPKYFQGSNILLILLAGQVFNLLTGPVGPLLVIAGFQNVTFLISGISLLINILAGLFFVPRFGVLGAAAASSLSIGFLYIVLLLIARHNLSVNPFNKSYLKLVLASVIVCIIGFSVKFLFIVSLLGLVAHFIFLLGIFLGILWLLGFESEDLALLSIFNKILLRLIRK